MDATPLDGADRAHALRAVAQRGVIVGPQYAKLAGLHVGDRVRLRGPGGTRDARVAGDHNRRPARRPRALRPGRRDARAPDPALVAEEYPGLELASMADVKRQQQDQVSATFNMFNSIGAIAVIVSLLGVVNTLAMSVLERTREIDVLRALGSSRWQSGARCSTRAC